MSVTNRIAAQTLTQGQSTSMVVYPGAEVITLRLTTLVPYAALIDTPQTLLYARDNSGRVCGSCTVTGAGTSQFMVQNFETQVLTLEVVQPVGTSVIQVDEITGIEARCGQALIDADDIVDGSILAAKFAGGAVTLPKLSGFVNIKCLAFTGVAVPGPCACAGAAVGDRVIQIFGATTAAGANLTGRPLANFEPVITVVDQIQQATATDYSLYTFIALMTTIIS